MAPNGQPWRSVLGRACAALILTVSPAIASAEQQPTSPANPQTASTAVPSAPDFLLGRPRASVSVRGGWTMASAGSDIYDFFTSQLTVDRADFNGATFMSDVAFSITPRVDVLGGINLNAMSKPSHYRGYSEVINGQDMPIQQTTELRQIDLAGSVRLSLVPRGREVSQYAWIPSGFVPYVGGGAGFMHYQLKQYGDFVDFADLDIFTDNFSSAGWSPSAHVFAGSDFQLVKRLYLTVEGRFTWVHAELDQDFIGFEPIDLGGFKLAAGINFVF
jgi:hypothetical protein